MDGGIDLFGNWIKFGKFPYEIMRNKWKYYLLRMIRKFSPDRKTLKLVDELWREYDKGFVFYIVDGEVPTKIRKLTSYIAKYLFRPSISLKRIKKYDEEKRTVTYEYCSHETNKMEIEKTDVLTFIGRMVQQILPKGFQRVRYYGLQSTRGFKKYSDKISKAMESFTEEDALSKDPNLFIAPSKKTSFSDKVFYLTGQNPLRCKKCGHQMELVQIWIKGKGTVYDLLAYLKSQATGPPKIIEVDHQKIKTQQLKAQDLLFQNQQMSLLDTIAS